jgi:hypothetical protein
MTALMSVAPALNSNLAWKTEASFRAMIRFLVWLVRDPLVWLVQADAAVRLLALQFELQVMAPRLFK